MSIYFLDNCRLKFSAGASSSCFHFSIAFSANNSAILTLSFVREDAVVEEVHLLKVRNERFGKS